MAKMILNDWEDHDIGDFKLSLLHSSLEDYRLAYLINHCTSLRLRAVTELSYSMQQGINSQHSAFHSHHQNSTIGVFLVANRSFASINENEKFNLFLDEAPSQVYILPKYAKWDYFLLSDDFELLNSINNSLQKTEITAYQIIDFQSIKSSEQAVFTNYIYENEY